MARVYSVLKTLTLCTGLIASPGQAQEVTPHPFGDWENAWLDDRTGTRAVEWADTRTRQTLEIFAADPKFETLLNDAGNALTRAGRYPRLSYHQDLVLEYYQDAEHPLGIWRQTARQAFFDGTPTWETLIDLDTLSDMEKRKWFFAGAQCRENRCLVSLSDNGKDAHEVREFDLTEKQFVSDGFTLPEDKSSLWWVDTDSVMVASNLSGGKANENGYPATLRLWSRGQSLSESNILFETKVSDAFTGAAFIGANGGKGFIATRAVDYYNTETFYVEFEGGKYKLPLPSQYRIRGLQDGQLLLTVAQDYQPEENASFEAGSLISIDLQALLENREIRNPQQLYKPSDDEAIRAVSSLGGKLYVALLRDHRSAIVELSQSETGWAARDLSVPENMFISMAGSQEGQLLLKTEAPFTPASLSLYQPETGALQPVYTSTEAFDTSNLEMHLLRTQSRDGTEISYTIMHQQGLEPNGQNPTLVYGYGGFDVSITPRYEPIFGKLWLEKGGVYVHAYIRGGGERGPRWHQSAMNENRQLAYDDMIAVVEDLQARKISSPQHTGIMGRSNGGLMVANVMVQRPDLLNAVVIGGPLLDMLAYQLLPPGASWTAEYGDPRDGRSVTDYLSQYSPLHRLQKTGDYPTPLLITSLDDDRVLPGHARRFQAKMEQLGHPAFYFEDKQGGHYWELAGGPAPGDWRRRIQARAVEFTYLWNQLSGGEFH